MKKIVFLLLILFPTVSFATDWSSIGPANLDVLNYYTGVGGEILCTTKGMLVQEGNDWVEYSVGNLPVLNVIDLDQNNLLVLMGNGSWSDGIYKFNLTSRTFDVLEWEAFPNFLYEYNFTFYVGGYYGLLVSTDGLAWQHVEYFNGLNCQAMSAYMGHRVVSEVSNIFNIHYSEDAGATWHQAPVGAPMISDMVFDWQGKLYGVFPDYSYSSGLWSSPDYGITWNVEFWSTGLSAVYHMGTYIFVGWRPPDNSSEGVAIWAVDSALLVFLNDNLPDLRINQLTQNMMINCLNVVACTKAGAYITCDIPSVSINDEETIFEKSEFISNYPNPFAGRTNIQFWLEEPSVIQVSIFNTSGQLINKLFNGQLLAGFQSIVWDGKQSDGREVASGAYWCQLRINDLEFTKRLVKVE